MKFFRKALILFFALLLVLAIWIWWNRPRKVNMTAYVPADSLIYLEANDLPDIASGIISTDAWKALAPAAGIKSNLGNLGWLSRLASWTGIGPADSVVLSRAQIAVTVLGLDAADAGDTLKIKPRYALVVETHTGESRARYAVENRVGDFARRAYGAPRVEQKETDGAKFTTWVAPDGERRIVAAVMGSVAVIGNDEGAVQACLAVRRNERPSLVGNPQVEEMRRRVGGNDALAFGYVSPEGATKLLEMAATAYAGQISSDPRAQSAAASMLPPLAKKILGGAGWSARLSEGIVEDRYFLGLQNGVATKLQSALASQQNVALSASELLPAEIYSLSRYNYRDPAGAWRGLNSTIAAQADTLGSVLLTRLLDASLKPYGIEEPDNFLQAIGSEIVTARLDDSGSSTVTIVEVRDEKTLRDFIAKRLGAKPRAETIGDAEMLVANNEKRDASSFVQGHLIMGTADNVRRCLEALRTNQTLAADDDFQRTARLVAAGNSANVVTFTEDYAPARTFITAIATQRGIHERPVNETELEGLLKRLRYAVSETQIVDGGFEKRTRSSFGQFGALASQFAPANDSTASPQ
ncbi:MAG: hypothetical protein QOH25_349 [Acidobacteriota bacterium]|jgi:hypothetical protein|nr:hypothetical protein [Acidobacteriota bacterium]